MWCQGIMYAVLEIYILHMQVVLLLSCPSIHLWLIFWFSIITAKNVKQYEYVIPRVLNRKDFLISWWATCWVKNFSEGMSAKYQQSKFLVFGAHSKVGVHSSSLHSNWYSNCNFGDLCFCLALKKNIFSTALVIICYGKFKSYVSWKSIQ